MEKITFAADDMMIPDMDIARAIIDSSPLSCIVWNHKLERFACNDEAVRLFGMSSKQEFLERIYELSPEYQPSGELTRTLIRAYLNETVEKGSVKFEWMHQSIDESPIPCEVSMVRVPYKAHFVIVSHIRDLRHMKAAIAKMREADERSQIMLDATPLCANFWDRDYNNIDCNQEAVNLFNLPNKQEYLDRFNELSPEYQPCGRPSSEMALENIKTAFKEGYCRFEWMHQKLTGEQIPAEITLVRVKYKDDYIVVGYTRDLRELKATMEQMREADERTQIMLDATPLCANFWDRDFNNIDCNQEAVNLFDLSCKQEYLDRFGELSPKYQPNGQLSSDMALHNIQTAFKDGYCRFEWMHQKLTGEQVPAEITLVRVKYRGDYIVVGYTRDMRELKAMLSEMHKVEDDLRTARDLAEKSAHAKSEFLANMSHEIRTPMNGILGLLGLVLKTETTPKQHDYLLKAEQSAKNLLRIINDILDFSKIEAGKLEMEYIEFDLKDVLDNLKTAFSQRIKEKGLTLCVRTPETMPKKLIGDPLRLEQVFVNLISNAIKFTSEGGITVSVDDFQISGSRISYQFSVKDTGIGMTPEHLSGLFVPFTQADTSTTRKYGGTGLGLAISNTLVGMMNGTIYADSVFGEGSTFYFTARFEVPKVSESSGNTPMTPDFDSAVSNQKVSDRVHLKKNIHLLLVEDNDINQMIAEELLTSEGYQVEIACNGLEAINMLQAASYDLILMDIQMPVMDGLTATRNIRQIEPYRTIPIIAMSAHAMTGDREASLAAGMNDHLTKPIDPKILSEALERWLHL